ncbi:DinB family protein [Umezawaea sp. Da 62-37]|uniref:DinB family protein n=1 Tax=Umezawaea sp. Da 62-37 TaxID=3075927 RepID=UPI0028F7007D|nr:DinB family protein [Umezawaea sp. Da 62-37]WNV87349.1 DinB family protein [Umezawaea sp. Da 62-37]
MDQCPECDHTYDLDEALLAGLAIREGIAAVVGILRDHAPADLAKRRQPDTWSPLEYACHLRDMLLVQRERVLAARRTDRPVCTPMGRDERVEHDGYGEQNPLDVARQLADAALLFTTVLDRLDPTTWSRTLVYSYPEPTERTLRWVAAHTLHEVRHHLLDIRRQVG